SGILYPRTNHCRVLYWYSTLYWLFNYWLRLCDYFSFNCCYNKCCSLFGADNCHFTCDYYRDCPLPIYATKISDCLGSCSIFRRKFHFTKYYGKNNENSSTYYYYCFTCSREFIWYHRCYPRYTWLCYSKSSCSIYL